ncbi:MAG: M67 family metallopeptidase [Proteobacteria bacterium]|nr:M67 family metallopeptidase [Pseudomonadota bacterium]
MAASLREQIAREARAAFPGECCGLIEGDCDGVRIRVTAVHPTRNLAKENDRFEIDPIEQFALLRAARARGGEIVGCYHSHPNGRVEPSARDLENAAEEGFLWVIAAVDRGRDVVHSAFLRAKVGFEELPETKPLGPKPILR